MEKRKRKEKKYIVVGNNYNDYMGTIPDDKRYEIIEEENCRLLILDNLIIDYKNINTDVIYNRKSSVLQVIKNGDVNKYQLPTGNWIPLGNLDQITDNDAKPFVKNNSFGCYKNYFSTDPGNIYTFDYPKSSFNSLISSKIPLENTKEKPDLKRFILDGDNPKHKSMIEEDANGVPPLWRDIFMQNYKELLKIWQEEENKLFKNIFIFYEANNIEKRFTSENEPKTSVVIDTSELKKPKLRVAEVEFDCVVRMFDLSKENNKWFKSEFKISLEMIKNSTPTEMGHMVKDAFYKLQEAVTKRW